MLKSIFFPVCSLWVFIGVTEEEEEDNEFGVSCCAPGSGKANPSYRLQFV
jgi:hypothetical protein